MPEPPPTAPVPVFAEFEIRSGRFIVGFDQTLQTRPLNVDNWTFFGNGTRWQTQDAQAQLQSVKGGARFSLPSGAGPWVNYLGTPPDVRNLADMPAAPFAQFPVTFF